MDHLTFPTEIDRQKALEVIDDLIQKTRSASSRALYEQQHDRIVSAVVEDHVRQPLTNLGLFPASPPKG